MFAGRVRIVSHLSCRTSAILKYFCPLRLYALFLVNTFIYSHVLCVQVEKVLARLVMMNCMLMFLAKEYVENSP